MKKQFLTIVSLLLTLILINNAYAIQGSGTQQVQSGNTVNQNDTGTGTQVQQQEQQQLQDGTGDGEQVQNQNQVQGGSENSQQRMSQVSNAVQEMIQIAERNSGIGQQIKTIAQAQNQNQIKLEESLGKVQNRSGFVKFFVGPNYGEINNAQKIIEQNREQIQQLNQTMSQIANQSDQQTLTEQIKILEQSNIDIESALRNSEKGFSLLGWAFRLLFK